MHNTTRNLFAGATLAFACLGAAHAQTVGPDGIIRVRSNHSVEETVARIRADIAAMGVLFFHAVVQAQIAAKAGIKLRPSTLLEFGNLPLGAQFLTANSNAGLDWPVRLLVTQDESGTVQGVGSLDRFRLDCETPRHHRPQEAVRYGHRRGAVHHLIQDARQVGLRPMVHGWMLDLASRFLRRHTGEINGNHAIPEGCKFHGAGSGAPA